jgi:hypothetical protein
MSQQPVSFNARQLSLFSANLHVYRVYVLPGKLLFIKIGTGYRGTESTSPESVNMQLPGMWELRRIRETLAIREKREQLEKASLEELQGMAKFADGCF